MRYETNCVEKFCQMCGEPESTGCVVDTYVRCGKGYISICRKCLAEVLRHHRDKK